MMRLLATSATFGNVEAIEAGTARATAGGPKSASCEFIGFEYRLKWRLTPNEQEFRKIDLSIGGVPRRIVGESRR